MGHRDRERVRVREDHQVTEMRLRFSGAIALTTAACAAPSATCRAQSTQLAGADSTTAAVVSSLRIHRENVFDRAESSSWLFRAANSLHIVTREHVVRRELLIPVGAPFDSATANETARNLRKLGIFRKVQVDSSTTPSGLVEDVTTHDSWTTQVQASFKSTGDQVTWTAGVAEKNLLGRQIKAQVKYTSDPDRSTTQFSASFPRVWRGLVGIDAGYRQYSDGESADFTASSPFRTLATRKAATLDVDHADRSVLRFFEGEEVASDTLRHLLTKAALNAGWAARGSQEGYVRLGAKLQLRRENYAALGVPIEDRSFFAELGGAVEWSSTDFSVVEGYRGLGGKEDVDLSATVRGEVWVAPSAWGYQRTGVGPALRANVGKTLTQKPICPAHRIRGVPQVCDNPGVNAPQQWPSAQRRFADAFERPHQERERTLHNQPRTELFEQGGQLKLVPIRPRELNGLGDIARAYELFHGGPQRKLESRRVQLFELIGDELPEQRI